jgi:acyl-CoA reductase-like NAD-dependent aldehyde dehydrogenase
MSTNIDLVPAFLDGEIAAIQSAKTIEVINPSNGRPCCVLATGSEVDLNRAVASSRRSFEDGRWADAPPSFRKNVLRRWAELIAAEGKTLDLLDAEDMGKPVGLALANAAGAAQWVEFCAEAADKITGDVYNSDCTSLVVQRWVPRGIVGAVVPWNFPTYNSALKVAPALAAGNCVVLKPSELSPRSALRLAELAAQAGVPAGVFNVIHGVGDIVGRGLGLHPEIDMITFTGSTAVGKAMLQYSGQSNMKVVMTECGGKSPQIVFDDGVDLAAAGEVIAGFLLTNQGQLCSAGTRLLVQRSIEQPLLEHIVACLGKITMGDARDPKTTFGPVATAKQCARIMRHIEEAPDEGAERVIGGRQMLKGTGGFFIEPTIFRNVRPMAKIAQEEIFGPVLSVITFDNESEAIRIANGTIYGLTAYLWTANLSRGMRIAKSIRSSVTINGAVPAGEGAGHAVCWEPARQSGIGVEGGIAGIKSYLRRQSVRINHG